PPVTWASRLAAAQTPEQRAASIAAAAAAAQRLQAERLAAAQRAAAEAAAAAAARALAQRQAAAPLGCVAVLAAARNHYTDGWGAAYGITTDAALRTRVEQEWVRDTGTCSFDLGTHRVRDVTSGCSVLYRNEWRDAWDNWEAVVWHCGPNLR